MVARRTYRKRRGTNSKKKRGFMTKARPARAISTANKGVSFKRSWFSTSWAFGATTTNDFWRRFAPRFSEIPNYLEYANLFDEYKITGIKVTFHPRFGATNLPNNAANNTVGNNQMYITIANGTKEYNLVPTGAYSSTTYNNFLEELGSKARTIKFDKPVSIYFKPHVFEEIGGASGYGYKQTRAGWFETATSLQPTMHGAHAFIHDYNFTNQNITGFGCDIQYTFYFQCRGQA